MIFILILDTKDPHFSEVKEVSITVPIFHLHLHNFGVVIEGKADLAGRGRLLVFGCIDNEVFERWVVIEFVILFFIDNEVDVMLHFPYYINFIVDHVYDFVGPHFSELPFGVVPEVEVKELQSLLLWLI